MSNLLIKCTELTLAYEKRPVVYSLDLEIEKGSCLCVLGENGSGKSTLIKGLVGLIRPESGKIEYLGGLEKSDIGYLPQQSAAQKDFPASVEEIVTSGTIKRSIGFAGAAEKRLAEENMELLGITYIKKESFASLSGGQQQRVLLARAMCAAKKLLVLDEPVTGLDPLVSGELYNIIEEKNKKDGLTVITVSHSPEQALKSATRVLHLCNCGARFFGTPEEYVSSDVGKDYLSAAGREGGR